MSDSYGDPQPRNKRFDGNREDSRGNFRGGRGAGGRESGGFRIRLSDNEMRAARSLQEAFNLRSTVAVLGFAIRTLAQMLEEGKLEELVSQSRNQASQRREDSRQGFKGNHFDGEKQNFKRGAPKPNPFARPEKPKQPTEDKDSEELSASEKHQPDGSNALETENDEASNSSDENQKVDLKESSSNDEKSEVSTES